MSITTPTERDEDTDAETEGRERVDVAPTDDLDDTSLGDTDTDTDTEVDEGADEEGSGGGPSRLHRLTGPFRRGGTERVLAVVAILGLLGTALFSGLWITERRADQGEAAMRAEGEQFLLALTNFDAATVDEDFDRIVDMGTGDFRDQADQFFGSDVREALKEVQASSRGEVREIYVQSFSGDRGRVFAVVDQTIANNRFPQPQADQLRVELTLEHTGGEWRVSDVLVLEAPNAAGGGATAAADGAAAEGS
jgi:Mce-associated membrane protein